MTQPNRSIPIITWVYFMAVLVNVASRFSLVPDTAALITKPLLMPLLMVLLTVHKAAATNKIIIGALLLSWLGDLLLMYESDNLFIAGVGCFLLAHVLYTTYCRRLLRRFQNKFTMSFLWLLVPVLIYGITLVAILWPSLNAMRLPVTMYAVVICIMVATALLLHFQAKEEASRLLLVGAALFVVSDSLLAINKFYLPFKVADGMVMLTYGAAQWLIVKGAIAMQTRGQTQ